MNSFYSLLKVVGSIRSPFVRHCGVLAFYLLKKRYLGLYLDPTKACNLKCRMCFFSGESHKHPDRTQLSLDDYKSMADAMFHRVMRLQIGCGAEPTLYKELVQLVRIGRERRVPHISLTTNGNLLTNEKLEALAEAGLDELILSVHGLTKATYEYLMQHARFDVFMRLLGDLKEVKAKHPGFKLRINYTVNENNVDDLLLFPDVFAGLDVDVLQVRPIQNLGDSDYKNFCLDKVYERYDSVFGLLKEYAGTHGTLLIIPTKENLDVLASDDGQEKAEDYFQDLTYVYGSPGFLWRKDFDFKNDTFESYCKKKGYLKAVLCGILPFMKHADMEFHKTRALNYTVK